VMLSQHVTQAVNHVGIAVKVTKAHSYHGKPEAQGQPVNVA
jgi:hypothetical protein